MWAINHNISNIALNALLVILKKIDICKGLPNDSRALFKTPKNTKHKIISVSNGTLIHFPLEDILLKFLFSTKNDISETKCLNLDINIDGLPLSKSSNSQLWPILGSINLGYINRYIIRHKTSPEKHWLQAAVDVLGFYGKHLHFIYTKNIKKCNY